MISPSQVKRFVTSATTLAVIFFSALAICKLSSPAHCQDCHQHDAEARIEMAIIDTGQKVNGHLHFAAHRAFKRPLPMQNLLLTRPQSEQKDGEKDQLGHQVQENVIVGKGE